MNGYIEIEILGRKRGLKFGALAFEKIGGALAFVEQAGDGFYNLKFIVDIVHAGLLNNCYRKNELPDFKYEDVFDFIEDNAGDESFVASLTDVMKEFEQSKPIQTVLEQAEQKTKKKTGKK
jgi:hypothetical protein